MFLPPAWTRPASACVQQPRPTDTPSISGDSIGCLAAGGSDEGTKPGRSARFGTSAVCRRRCGSTNTGRLITLARVRRREPSVQRVIRPRREASVRKVVRSKPKASSRALQSIPPRDDFELAAHGFIDRDHRMHLEHECREHRAELVNHHRIVAFHQHVPAPFADPDHEKIDFETARGFPLTEDFKDSLLGVLVLDRRTLRALEPADYIFHLSSPPASASLTSPNCAFIVSFHKRARMSPLGHRHLPPGNIVE